MLTGPSSAGMAVGAATCAGVLVGNGAGVGVGAAQEASMAEITARINPQRFMELVPLVQPAATAEAGYGRCGAVRAAPAGRLGAEAAARCGDYSWKRQRRQRGAS